ncbi:MAG: hypothetical protein IT355_11260 [Gemmatimonadaceae bacterium]|nr:hypothetical protein [Gemmatimonadaceae bacterium]
MHRPDHRRFRASLVALCCGTLATPRLGAQADRPPMWMEASLWAGVTSLEQTPGAIGRTSAVQSGIRGAELSVWPVPSLRLFARYDNTFSLDNLALIRAGRSVPLYRAGVQRDWNHASTTVADVGRRTLPGSITQGMLTVEQVVFLPGTVALKAGGWVGPRSDARTEWLGFGALSVPIAPRVRIEPTYFHARSGLADERQWRALLAGEARLSSRLSLGGGAAMGHNTSITPRLTGDTRAAFARLALSLTRRQRVQLVLNRESAPGANTQVTLAAGFSVGVPRR